MKNVVIEVLDIEHRKKVIQFFKQNGIHAIHYSGHFCFKNTDERRYYGVIGGIFSNYNIQEVKEYNVEIITLEEKLKSSYVLPEEGQRILVWDFDEQKAKKMFFVTYLKNTKFPVVCVCVSDEENYIIGKEYNIETYKNWKTITETEEEEEKIVELTMLDISKGGGVGVKPHLIRIKN